MSPHARFLLSTLIVGLLIGVPLMCLRTLALVAGCSAAGMADDLFIAYCNNDSGFGYFEHGAYYFDVPIVQSYHARTADVIFLGNSRVQQAFSTAATRKFFNVRNIPYYLLGFSYAERARWASIVMRGLRVSPKVLVVNVDPFFEGGLSPIVTWVMTHGTAREEIYVKTFAQWLDRMLCSPGAPLSSASNCHEHPRGLRNSGPMVFRSQLDGSWELSRWCTSCREHLLPFNEVDMPPDHVARLQPTVKEFIRRSGVRSECVILTVIPSPAFNESLGALATLSGAQFVEPQLSADDLTTLDDSHLSPRSAEKWSTEFLRLASPYIDRCRASAADHGSSIP